MDKSSSNSRQIIRPSNSQPTNFMSEEQFYQVSNIKNPVDPKEDPNFGKIIYKQIDTNFDRNP